MPGDTQPSGAQQMLGGLARKLVSLIDGVLFGDVWERAELSPRDRSLTTIAALTAGGNGDQLPFHRNLGKDNGLTETEIVEPSRTRLLRWLAQGHVGHYGRQAGPDPTPASSVTRSPTRGPAPSPMIHRKWIEKPGIRHAATAWNCRVRGASAWPSGRSSPPSSKSTMPLQSKPHPCSGWLAMTWAAPRAISPAGGHCGS